MSDPAPHPAGSAASASTTPADSWPRVEPVLRAALELPVEARAEFLDRHLAGRPELRRAVQEYLDLEPRLGGFLEVPAAEIALQGQRIGPYRLLREVGRGGSSVVYLAVREERDFERRVAVKVIRDNLAGEDWLRRFLAERRILARLHHPGIAQLWDVGTTGEGLPFVVLEWVEGRPIDRDCDHHRRSVDERVDLFLEVCDAVGYAHRKLVVHRDLKPSNLLVTDDGRPKLLDFGIAKLLSGGDVTRTAVPVMTPGWASPEQIRGEPVTTASDVYSLGVLLWLLLVGDLPHRFPARGEDAGRGGDFLPASRAVARLAAGRALDSDADPGEVARCRRLPLPALSKRLTGDLDSILATALARDPETRYGSVERLADDLRRWRRGRPVTAREARPGYRAGKFLRRHPVAVPVVLLALFLIVGFAVLTGVQSQRLERERQQTEQVAGFLVQLFTPAGPRQVSGAALVTRGAARLEEWAAQGTVDPEVEVRLREALGRAGSGIGRHDLAVEQWRRALELRWRQDDGTARVAALLGLATALEGAGRLDRARQHFREAATRARDLGDGGREAAALEGLVRIVTFAGASAEELEAGLDLGWRAVALRRQTDGGDHPATARARATLARLALEAGRKETADNLFRRALENLPRDSDWAESRARALYGSGALLLYRGRAEAAEEQVREALQILRGRYGEDHAEVLGVTALLAGVKLQTGALAEAERLARLTVNRLRRLHGGEHPAVAREQYNLALVLVEQGQLAEAETLLRETVALGTRLVGADHPRVATAQGALARVVHARGRDEEAEALFRQALEPLEQQLPADHPDLAATRLGFAALLVDQGWLDEAEILLDQVEHGLRSHYGRGGHWTQDRLLAERGALALARGRRGEGLEILRRAQARLLESRGPDALVTRRAAEQLAAGSS